MMAAGDLSALPDQLEDIDLAALSSHHDSESQDTYLSVYIDLRRGTGRKHAAGGVKLRSRPLKRRAERFLRMRETACRKALAGKRDLLENFDRGMALVRAYLAKSVLEPEQKGLVLFSCPKEEYFEALKLSVPLRNLLVLDTSPYIRPLARLRDDWESIAVVIIDSEHARLFAVSSDRVTARKRETVDLLGKHKKGGMSQMRFQRLRTQAVRVFHQEVLEDLRELLRVEPADQVFIAGPGIAKTQFLDSLPHDIRGKVTEVVDLDLNVAEGEMLREFVGLASAEEQRQDHVQVQALLEQILKGGPVACGWEEVAEAARAGKVRVLLVTSGLKLAGWKCEPCRVFALGSRSTCPSCKRPVSRVDVMEETIEEATQRGARLEFVAQDPSLEALGGIGAFLRYK
jgi:peptide chain release factor subunit 1